MEFNNKSILFIGIGFYDYEHAIVERISQRGADVSYWADRAPVLRKKPWGGLCYRIPRLSEYIQRKYEQKILKRTRNKKFDVVFFIKAVDISDDFIQQLKNENPQSIFILYEWDSIARYPVLLNRFRYFDRIFSFDRNDAINFPFVEFRPLFYRYDFFSSEKEIDICFVGWMHSSRLINIRKLQKQAQSIGLIMCVYMTTNILTWLKLWVLGESKDIYINNISYKKAIEMNSKSRCALDLPHPDQSGLTMRSIESLGLDIKLITTSDDIANYDFFNEKMIKIIDINNPILDKDFIESEESLFYDQNIKKSYSLDTWLDDVFITN